MFAKLKKPPFIRVAELSTLVAQGVEITGDMVFGGGMRIDGRVQGNVVGRYAPQTEPKDIAGDIEKLL